MVVGFVVFGSAHLSSGLGLLQLYIYIYIYRDIFLKQMLGRRQSLQLASKSATMRPPARKIPHTSNYIYIYTKTQLAVFFRASILCQKTYRNHGARKTIGLSASPTPAHRGPTFLFSTKPRKKECPSYRYNKRLSLVGKNIKAHSLRSLIGPPSQRTRAGGEGA